MENIRDSPTGHATRRCPGKALCLQSAPNLFSFASLYIVVCLPLEGDLRLDIAESLFQLDIYWRSRVPPESAYVVCAVFVVSCATRIETEQTCCWEATHTSEDRFKP